MIVFWDVAPCTLVALMMEAANTSKTSIYFYQTTRRNIPEDSPLHTRRLENMKFHLIRISLSEGRETKGVNLSCWD
jgi:hypothetical protein